MCSAIASRLVNQNRNAFAATMVATGDADAMVTGLTRSFIVNYDDVRRVIDPTPAGAFGLSVAIAQERTCFLPTRLCISNRRRNAWPKPPFRPPPGRIAWGMSRASRCCPTPASASRNAATPSMCAKPCAFSMPKVSKFEYDGEMAADVALDYDLMKRLYPFCRLTSCRECADHCRTCRRRTSPANLLQNIGGVTMIGPIVIGLEKPVQIVRPAATVSDLVTTAALAAYQTIK